MSTATVVAKGTLTQSHGVNFLLMKEFEINPKPKSTDGPEGKS